MQDHQLIEKLAHQNRERIPERVVHAKGWGAHGTFTVTKDPTAMWDFWSLSPESLHQVTIAKGGGPAGLRCPD